MQRMGRACHFGRAGSGRELRFPNRAAGADRACLCFVIHPVAPNVAQSSWGLTTSSFRRHGDLLSGAPCTCRGRGPVCFWWMALSPFSRRASNATRDVKGPSFHCTQKHLLTQQESRRGGRRCCSSLPTIPTGEGCLMPVLGVDPQNNGSIGGPLAWGWSCQGGTVTPGSTLGPAPPVDGLGHDSLTHSLTSVMEYWSIEQSKTG